MDNRSPEEYERKIESLHATLAKYRTALEEAEACMSIVEPRSDKAEYIRILGVVRDAIGMERKGKI